MNKIQNRPRPRRQYRLHHQPPVLVQHRHRNRVPVDIHPHISHTIHQGVPFFALWLSASHRTTAAYPKGAPFYNACPTSRVLCEKWDSTKLQAWRQGSHLHSESAVPSYFRQVTLGRGPFFARLL